MFRNLRRALGLCLTAGAIGVGSALIGPVAAAEFTPGQVRAEAVKVELAWMADARTFNLSLQIQATAEGLEVRGQVADETMRQHVLRLARQACYMPVRDALQIGVDRPAGDDVLRRMAHGTIAQALGGRASHVAVASQPGGVVVLSGQVRTAADKLEAGRCLRGLGGCARVLNQIEVAAAPARAEKGDSFTPTGSTRLVSAEAAPPVPDELPLPKVKEEKKDDKPTPTTAALTLPDVPLPVLPSGAPPARYARIQVHYSALEPGLRPVLQPRITGYATSGTTTAAPPGKLGYNSCGNDVQLEMRVVDPPPTMLQRLFGAHFHHKPLHRPHAENEKAVVVAAKPSPTIERAALTQAAPPAAAPAPVVPPASPKLARSVITPAAPPPVWPPAHAPSKTSPAHVVSPAPEQPAIAPAVAHEKTGERAEDQPPAATIPHDTKAASISPERLQAQIVAGCGKLVNDVKLEKRANGTFTIHVHASAKVEQDLMKRLLSLSQVVSSGAHIQVHLAR